MGNNPKTKKIKNQTKRKFWGFSSLLKKNVLTGITAVSLVLQLVMPALLYPVPVLAVPWSPETLAGWDSFESAMGGGAGAGAGIPVFDEGSILQQVFQSIQDRAAWIADKAEHKAELTLREAVFVGLKQSFHYFLNTLAYDTATWLASGGEGQAPMFYTEGWGEYIANTVDAAAGEFIETVANDFLEVNVCNPSSINLKIGIVTGLRNIQRPSRPQCTATDVLRNWQRFATNAEFLNNIDIYFDPQNNDIGRVYLIFEGFFRESYKAEFDATKERESSGETGLMQKISKISEKILTPLDIIDEQTRKIIQSGTDAQWVNVQYGPIVGNAVETFVNTLAGQLFQKLLKEGLVSLSEAANGDRGSGSRDSFSSLNLLQILSRLRGESDDLFNEDSSAQGFGGTQAAELRFLSLLQAGDTEAAPYDVLNQLASCPDAKNPGPEECVIKSSVRLAVERELTLEEAINLNYIDGNLPFGLKDGSYLESIPYRSILILRAHRIVPVGWEIAAEAIHNAAANRLQEDKVYTLNDIIAGYNDENHPFYKLVDPKWVLKAPQHVCDARGYGEKLIVDQLSDGTDSNKDGDFDDVGDVPPERIIGRAEYCADYQSCIATNDDGSCKYYGHCTQERSVWDLNSVSCSDNKQYNTCMSFQQAGSGQTASYLMNTLDYNGCDASNTGCQWYCQEFNPVSNDWACVSEGENIRRTCAQSSGCNLTASCDVELGDISCFDTERQLEIVLDEACSTNSKYFDEDIQKCNPPETSCFVPQGGNSCKIDSCEALSNQLVNGNFESAGATGTLTDPDLRYVTQGWSTNLSTNSFTRVGGEQSKDGTYSLRFFSSGSEATETFTIQSDPVRLAQGNYTVTGYIMSRLNGARVTVTVPGSTITPTLTNNVWERFSINLPIGGESENSISITVSGNGQDFSGTAWFDNIRITEECNIEPVQIAYAGDAFQNQSKIHLDNDVEECDESNAGCSKFIRTKENSGANLITNGSFETWSLTSDENRGWKGNNFSQDFENPRLGSASVKLSPNAEISTVSVPGLISGKNYSLSFVARTQDTADQTLRVMLEYTTPSGSLQSVDFSPTANLTIPSFWRSYSLSSGSLPAGTDFNIKFINTSGRVINVDGVKIETVGIRGLATEYSEYGESGTVFLKKAPKSLGCTGDDDDPAICANYAPYCQANEVGCQAFTPVNGGTMVPGVVFENDYCPVECVGYSAYKQSPTYFETQETLEYFIPETARQCSAVSAGCDEFTNLDEVALGGEGKEYYKYLRLCKKPDAPGATCENFYSWQGSDDTGYQLQSHSLSVVGGVPELVRQDPADWLPEWGTQETCNGPEDLAVNPFCREMFGNDGSVHYIIEQNTVSCSNECHPYRKTRLGEDITTAELNCQQSKGRWTGDACIYDAIPDQGFACSASEAACREYRGNTGANSFTAMYETFEPGVRSGWELGDLSTEALTIGGHSLRSVQSGGSSEITTRNAFLSNGACSTSYTAAGQSSVSYCNETRTSDCFDIATSSCIAENNGDLCIVGIGETGCSKVGTALHTEKTYIISFWAKSGSANIISDVRLNMLDNSQELARFNLGQQWQYYKIGPVVLNDVLPYARLQFIAGTTQGFYVDNIKFEEIEDYAYVIRNSWNTPQSCDTNPYLETPTPAPQFMLGCEEYKDDNNQSHYLKSFTQLCREKAVGCEALIDTHNSTAANAQTFNIGDTVSQVDVPADELVYIANRSMYQCDSQFKGCQSVGLPTVDINNQITNYQSVNVINDPDKYDTILCGSNEVGCEEYVSTKGSVYFKNPGRKTCEYRLIPNSTANQYGWFITDSASATPDCPLITPLLGENHPSGFAGICPGEYSGCSMFVDPISSTGRNYVLNNTLKTDEDVEGGIPDRWSEGEDENSIQQKILLRPDTVYTLAVTLDKGKVSPDELQFSFLDCPNLTSYDSTFTYDGLQTFRFNREAYENDTRTITGLGDIRRYSGRFGSGNSRSCTLEISSSDSLDALKEAVKDIMLTETQINYSFEDSVDRTSCNGIVDEQNGCVLFNDRSAIDYRFGESSTSYLSYDADVSSLQTNNGIAVSSCQGACDTNVILKVKPDRECAEWLTCISQATVTKELHNETFERSYCLDVGLCDALDENGECTNYKTPTPREDLIGKVLSVNEIKNMSGFSKPAVQLGDDSVVRGYVNYADMDQFGSAANIVNGDFERTFNETSMPVGWNLEVNEVSEDWADYKFRVVNDGVRSVQGSSYLRLNAHHIVESEEIDIEPRTPYVISGWINTEYLRDSSGDPQLPNANICIENNGRVTCPADLYLEAGLGWTYKTFIIDEELIGNDNRIKIQLQNYTSAVSGLEDPDEISERRAQVLGGYSMFDDITLRPVLEVYEYLQPQGSIEYLSRSCRLYPTSSSLSCEVYETETTYYGQYGYCVLRDPQNPRQCLQWWPVDQLEGEIVDNAPVYNDRAPLYYCLEKKKKTVKISEGSYITRSNDLPEEWSFIEDQGGSIKAIPFKVSSEFLPLFRYPYVEKFTFNGQVAGIQSQGDYIGAGVFSVDMYRDGFVFKPVGFLFEVCPTGFKINHPDENCFEMPFLNYLGDQNGEDEFDVWGGWGAIPLYFQPLVISYPVNWTFIRQLAAMSFSELLGSAGWDLGGDEGAFIAALGNMYGAKIVTDQDKEFASLFTDPIPDVDGDILGWVWFFSNAATQASVIGGQMKGEFDVQYCSKLVQVVTSANSNKTWSQRISEGSGYVLTEFVEDYPLYSEDTETVFKQYVYDGPFQYDAFLADALNYHSSDYRPFGSLVQPDNAQYPDSWDSRTSVSYKQPLFYEPPRTSFPAPHQARMGEVHSISGLQQLFLKSYGLWEWREDVNSESKIQNDDAYYNCELPPEGEDGGADGSICNLDGTVLSTSGWDILRDWDADPDEVGDGYCLPSSEFVGDPENPELGQGIGSEFADGLSRINDVIVCRVRPQVKNILTNDISGVVLQRSGSVKLSFTATVDPNQMPLTSYVIDWGDGEKTTITGASLLDRPNPGAPFVLYHAYDNWQLVEAERNDEYIDEDGEIRESIPQLVCPEAGGTCTTKILIKVKDNWNSLTSCETSWASLNETALSDLCKPQYPENFVPMRGDIIVEP